MKKIVIGLLFGVICFSASGQNSISDSLIYFLVAHSIEDADRVKIFKAPKTTSISLDDKQELLGKYFSREDTAFIKYQNEHPHITKWKKQKFNKMRKVSITNRYTGTFPFFGFKGKDTYFISSPVFSKDLNTAVIYFNTFHKFKFYRESTGAGFVAIWRQENGKWKLIKSDMIWIT